MNWLKQTCALLLALVISGATLAAQDYGDAPAGYGLASAGNSLYERLGTQWDSDTSNPVTPAWTGDASDDGVASIPTWAAGASSNSVSIDVDAATYTQYLTMWVDRNDDGDFNDAGERFDHPSFPTSINGTYTFNGISIPAQNYSLHGTNKIAVRFILKFNSSITGPNDSFSYGEVEDYLFDVSTNFLISTPATLPDGVYDTAYNETLQTAFGVGGVSWQLTGGTLPPGLSLSSSGDLTGTPTTAAAGQTYNFDVTATDSSSPAETDTKSFTLYVEGLVINGNSFLPSASEGQPYSQQTFTVTNGSPPYVWTEIGSNLPAGLALTQNGDDFDLTGTPGTGTGGVTYTFTIEVSSGTVNEQRSFDLFVIGGPAQLPFTDDFSVDKGWTLGSGQGINWQRGPTGANTNGEPTTDTSPSNDNYVLGDNLGSDYPSSMGSTVWAESPAMDCSGISDVELSFQRWLGVEQNAYDHAYIEVSPDNGQNWTQVWENSGTTIDESAWSLQKLNISSVAGNQNAVKVRFGLGPTDGSVQYHGWSIDDLEIRELPSTTKLVLTNFKIDSIYSVGGTNPAPQCYTGEQYPVDLTLDNTTGNDIQVDSISFTVSEVGSSTPENVGTWTLSVTVPFTVPANTTGHVVSGVFNCTALSSSGVNVTLKNLCEIEGTEQVTNKPVETELEETFYVDNGPPPPPPSLEVHEVSYQGPLVDSGQSAAGTDRDFGGFDIDAGAAGWVNIVLVNGTSSDVDVDEPVLVGLDAAHFRLNTSQWTSPTMTLTPSGSTSQIFFSVNFNPHDLGQLDAQVEFTHTASEPAANPIVVPFTGSGTGNAPELEMHEIDYQGPRVTDGQPATGTNRDFGSVAAGASSQWLNIVLWNRFVSDTTIDPLPDISGADAGDFEIDVSQMGTPHVIPGDVDFSGTVYFSLRFAPTASSSLGTKSATVTFGHDASNPAVSPLSFEVTGEVTQSGPHISVYELDGSGNPSTTINNGDPAAGRRDFGQQNVNAGPTAYLEVEILNSGSSTLTLGAPTLTGTHPGDFVIDTTSSSPPYSNNLAPAATARFRIAFDPAGTGTRDATVEITHNGVTTGSPFAFDVTGTGMPDAPIMGVYEGGASGPAIAYSAPATGTSRDFGSRNINAGPSAPLTIFVENTGYQDLHLGSPSLSGSDTGDFVTSAVGFPVVIAPQGSVTFEVAFDPDSFGNKSATVTLSHNDPQVASPFAFEVTGFGDAPQLEVREGSVAGPVIASGDPHDFGQVQIAVMPTTPLTLVLVNIGNADLSLPSPSLSGPNAGDFTLGASGFPLTLPPNDDATLTVSFNAAEVGLKEATLNIGHNAGGTNPFTLELTGIAEDPNGVAITTQSALEDARGGESYRVTLQAAGGVTPYVWSVRNGNLPPGLGLSTSGEISGRPPDQSASYTFEVRVTDARGGTDDRSFTISVNKTSISGDSSGGDGCSGKPDGASLWVLLALVGGVVLRRQVRSRGHSGLLGSRSRADRDLVEDLPDDLLA